ncbi:MAG: hypothetical protein JWL81_863 [Verrucomicrobiales bacterium]|nr:hypothetical protein [Verrucomicrobiales bacterium]
MTDTSQALPGELKPRARVRVICLVLGLYVFTYWTLSISGTYIPSVFGFGKLDGANHVKWHIWCPKGFPDHRSKFKKTWQWLFTPLWALDSRVWHPSEDAFDTGYRRVVWESDAKSSGWRIRVNP